MKQKRTLLQQANEAFREKKYELAFEKYTEIKKTQPNLVNLVDSNLSLCSRRFDFARKKIDLTIPHEKKISFNKMEKYYSRKEDAFDEEFYNYTYPDIKDNGICPVEHYFNWGFIEGRKPNSWFDPIFYKEKYLKGKENQEPLTHFVEEGQKKGFYPKPFRIPKLSKKTLEKIPKIQFDKISEEFTDYEKKERNELAVKVIAFYLPQFHPFPENDEWWGKGFTEWTNVTKAKPNYDGHYQPHLPIHNGFYDLRVPEVMIEQAKLAKNYGVYGFNFYYYWFDGKILMHKPFEILLKNKEIDIPFCITWANENWTRRWDGAEHDILIGQNHCEEDSKKFIENLFQFFEDSRYIRINDKPLLIIYHPQIIPEMQATLKLWRDEVVKAGYKGLYIVCAQTFGLQSPETYGFDAAMQFPPHTVKSDEISADITLVNRDFHGKIYDYNQVVNNAIQLKEPDYKLFRTCMLSWDNTARKQNNSHIFSDFSLTRYKQWLNNLTSKVFHNEKYNKDEKLVFVNAWNEWAEGTHLEPDRKHGYGYLEATHQVVSQYDKQDLIRLNRPFSKNNEYAVILHVHYTEIWDDINHYLKNLCEYGFDLFVTVTNKENSIVDNILDEYPDAIIRLVENRGRDILPFIEIYNVIKDFGYKAICKIHSKKSEYRSDGAEIRNELYEGLLGSAEVVNKALTTVMTGGGIFCPEKFLIPHTDHNMTYDSELVASLCELLKLDFEYSSFPAGSMYWFTPEALRGLEKVKSEYFDVEYGLADGTLAHAVERVILNLASTNLS